MAFKSKRVEKLLYPILLVMQTMPQYAVLVPAIVLFGVGDHAAVIITMVVAVPPMILLTLLGLRGISPEVIEAGKMSGCSNWQLMSKVLIPTARRDILIGVNQVIMVCFSMAVISAFIGAKGLGFNLLLALNQLNIGLALEAGLCISLIAILLDKMSLAWANKQIDYFGNLTFFQRHKNTFFFIVAIILGIVFAYIGSFYFKEGFNYFFEIPHNKGISTADFWNKGVDWIFDTFFVYIKAFNTWLIVDVLQPMRALYLRMPAVATLVLVVGAGYIIGGIRSALIVCGLTLFIALSPWWDRALVTTYMATFGVVISCIIGFTVGTLCFQNKNSASFMLGVCDIFQTFPSFVYLIPVMMLFGITDTSVLIAVIVYATIPATRYTIEGLRSVPAALHDAATMSGVTKFQRLFKIEFPLAFPHMMLGLNQTIVFALFMVIIGAFIGTEDLGQYILKALSDKNGAGIGLTLGLCVAFIGLIFDNLIRTWVDQRKKHLGLS
jgi:glycine betaine/proline transport system permease protein